MSRVHQEYWTRKPHLPWHGSTLNFVPPNKIQHSFFFPFAVQLSQHHKPPAGLSSLK